MTGTNTTMRDAQAIIGRLVDCWPREHAMPRELAGEVDRVYDALERAAKEVGACALA